MITNNLQQRLEIRHAAFNPDRFVLFQLDPNNERHRLEFSNACSFSQDTNPDNGALSLGSLGLRSRCALVPRPTSMCSGHGSRRTICADSSSRAGPSGPLLYAIQQAHEEDVAWEFIHGTLHQRPALWAAQLPA